MSALLMAFSVAQRKDRGLAEFGSDPLLSLACIALIVVAVAWVVFSRKITRNLDRKAMYEGKKIGEVRPARDIWRDPP